MKCVIHGPNIKLFAKALYALAKIGEDLYLEAQSDGLALRTTNSSRSAFMCYLFYSPFFSVYDHESDEQKDSEDDNELVISKCKLSMKAILMAFRSVGSLDKIVDSCTISISDKLSKTKIDLSCRFSVLKTYTLPFIECESIKASYNASQGCNKFTAHAKVLTEAALNFLTNQEEVSMYVDVSKFCLRNYVDNEDDTKKVVHTELNMTPAEFEVFEISKQANVTYCLKELRAFISFADTFNFPVTVCFDEPGNPIVFSVQSPETLEAVLVMATIDGDDNPDNDHNNTTVNRSQPDPAPTNQVSSCRVSDGALHDSQASFNFSSKRRMSASAARQQSTFSLAADHTPVAPVPSTSRNSVAADTQPSLQFKSFRRISGSAKSKQIYNDNTDSESDTETDPVSMPGIARQSDALMDASQNVDVLDSTPPSKRAKFFFQRCFDATFDPSRVRGADKILAPDSDPET